MSGIKVPDGMKLEYMTWRGKALVIAGLVMLLAIMFVFGLWEGYKLGQMQLDQCFSALKMCLG